MAIITRNRAKEFYFVELAPRSTAHYTVCHRTGYGIKHDIQAGVSIDNDIVRRYLHHITNQFLYLLDAGKNAVVTAVGSILTGQI